MIPFNKPYMTGKELWYISQAHHQGILAGDGFFTKRCHESLEGLTGCKKALLTHSCTAALEMAAILAGVGPGDEVIMPSYTFVSTANAFVLQGGVPVFVDIDPSTLNIDVAKIEAAITERTKVIVPVHYAGVGCQMEVIMEIANRHGLMVVEDAAQGLMASRDGVALGSIGHFGTISFHETKNVISGEGGALLINDESFVDRAEIIREKGTNRSKFFRGQVDKYTWVDVGSSYLPGEIISAFLLAQLEEAHSITNQRLQRWDEYHESFSDLEAKGFVLRPVVPSGCQHNAHMYYLLVENFEVRTKLLNFLNSRDVNAVFHYVPLHSSPAGKKYSRTSGEMTTTNDVSSRIIRLPLYHDLTQEEMQKVVESVEAHFY